MKKIVVIMLMLVLLTSCFKKDKSDEIIEEGAENITNILEQEASTEEETNETSSGVTTKFNEEKASEKVEETVIGTWEIDSKTEEQIVKEFEAEIDSLFNLIDEDGKK